MKHIFFSILTTLALFGCNAQDKAEKQSLFCYVRYDETLKAAKAEATLQGVTSKTSQEFPGGIRYQGMEMKLTPIYGMSYGYEYPAEFISDHVFEWRNAANEKQVFRLNINPVKDFGLQGKSVSRAKPAVLSWEGNPLGKGETLVMMWENAAAGLTVPMEATSSSGEPIIDIPAAKVQELKAGDWTLYLVRKKLMKDTIAGMAANGITEYYSKTIPVKVTE